MRPSYKLTPPAAAPPKNQICEARVNVYCRRRIVYICLDKRVPCAHVGHFWSLLPHDFGSHGDLMLALINGQPTVAERTMPFWQPGRAETILSRCRAVSFRQMLDYFAILLAHPQNSEAATQSSHCQICLPKSPKLHCNRNGTSRTMSRDLNTQSRRLKEK